MEVILVRHGLPLRVERDAGAADPPLSPSGRGQADAVAGWLARQSIDVVYSSPMRRAVETAGPFVAASGLPLNIHPDVAEFDRHASSYVPMEELKAQNYPAWKSFVDGGYGDDREMLAFRVTVVSAIEEIIARHPGRRVAVFCHGGVVNMWAGHVLEMTPRLFLDARYASVSRFLCASSGERSIVSLNETQHLVGV